MKLPIPIRRIRIVAWSCLSLAIAADASALELREDDSTIEVWAWNSTIEEEESMVSWSKRGTSGRNMSFNYGVCGACGSIGFT